MRNERRYAYLVAVGVILFAIFAASVLDYLLYVQYSAYRETCSQALFPASLVFDLC